MRNSNGRVAEAQVCLQAAIESPREARTSRPSPASAKSAADQEVDMSVSAKARSNPPLRSIPGPQQPDAE
jgi:hypothetical protein